MSTYKVAWNASTKVATILMVGEAIPSGSINAGNFDHNDDPDDELGIDENHVLYHHVRDLLYKQGFTDMAIATIRGGITSISIRPTEAVTLTAAKPTHQLSIVKVPDFASGSPTWTSSDPTKATVNASGLVTRVANGTTTITANLGGRTATKVVTVTS